MIKVQKPAKSAVVVLAAINLMSKTFIQHFKTWKDIRMCVLSFIRDTTEDIAEYHAYENSEETDDSTASIVNYKNDNDGLGNYSFR